MHFIFIASFEKQISIPAPLSIIYNGVNASYVAEYGQIKSGRNVVAISTNVFRSVNSPRSTEKTAPGVPSDVAGITQTYGRNVQQSRKI